MGGDFHTFDHSRPPIHPLPLPTDVDDGDVAGIGLVAVGRIGQGLNKGINTLWPLLIDE